MAKIDRYGGNLKAFASEQLTNERTLFGEVTIANDLTSQITAQFLRGWGTVGPSDSPSLQDFNAAMYTHGQLLAYLHQMGVAEYNAAQEYFIGSVTQAGGVLYLSLTNANIGNAPASSPSNWKGFAADQATELALGLVKIATQTLTNSGADDLTAVTPKKLAATIQGQKHTSFPTTGTATAQILTPVPAITAYATGQGFNVTFNVASGLNPTINVSGQGAKLLRQYDSTGSKVAAVFSSGQISGIVYDGTDFVLMDRLPAVSGLLDSVRLNVASSASINLISLAPNTRHINITGSTSISSFVISAGQCYFVRFDGIGQLTNSASLVTQSGANIPTDAGDTCVIRATANNIVEVLLYTPATPQALGYLQTRQNVTGSRAIGTTYTNSTNRTICAYVRIALGVGVTSNALLGADIVSTFANNGTGGTNFTHVLVIKSGESYGINNGTLQSWYEVRT